MSGYEVDVLHSAGGFLRTVPDTPWSHGYRFSNRYSLPEQGNCENTMHSRQKCHLSRQSPACTDT